MTDWRQVHGSQPERPEEFDLTTSSVVVYQRKNIERISIKNNDGTTIELWQYDEREMTKKEYTDLSIMQNRADIDYLSMEIGVEL